MMMMMMDGRAAIMREFVQAVAPTPLWAGETNSISCGGAPGVSDTYASTLWVLDYLAEMSKAGVVGANFHGGPDDAYAPVVYSTNVYGQKELTVRPLYYGLLAFTELVANKSSWLLTSSSGGMRQVEKSAELKNSAAHVAFSDSDHTTGCVVHRVLIVAKDQLPTVPATAAAETAPVNVGAEWRNNDDAATGGEAQTGEASRDVTATTTVAVSVMLAQDALPPHAQPPSFGVLLRLRAPLDPTTQAAAGKGKGRGIGQINATSGLDWAGQTFDGSRDGRLQGRRRPEHVQGQPYTAATEDLQTKVDLLSSSSEEAAERGLAEGQGGVGHHAEASEPRSVIAGAGSGVRYQFEMGRLEAAVLVLRSCPV